MVCHVQHCLHLAQNMHFCKPLAMEQQLFLIHNDSAIVTCFFIIATPLLQVIFGILRPMCYT